jgi:glycine oxidase
MANFVYTTRIAQTGTRQITFANHVVRTFDYVVDCRGFGARPQLPALRGVRGELIYVRTKEVELNRPVRLMHPRYPIYIVPRLDHQFVIGATQIESDYKGPVTLRSGLELLSAAYAVHPGFAEAEILELRADCRPAFNDNIPRIIATDGHMHINGLFRHGFLLAPIITEMAAEIVAGKHLQEFPQALVTSPA